MKLDVILKELGIECHHDIEINKLTTNSKEASENDIFLAIKGNLYDGNDYIDEVIKQGCKVIFSEYNNLKTYKSRNIYKTKKIITKLLYSDIIENTSFIGVTGTNGKTTTTHIIYHILRTREEYNVILVGTSGIYYNDIHLDINNTTPDELVIFNFIKDNINNNRKTYVVMEVSSHSLSLNRIDHIDFDMAIYLNLSHEHLDYYKTIEEYGKAKSSLFKKIKNNKIAIINIDDNYAYKMIFLDNDNQFFGKNCYKNKIKIIESDLKKITFMFNNEKYEMKLIGNYNVYNAASAILCLKNLGFSYNEIKDNLKQIDKIPGRMEIYTYHNKNVIIDFAHTPVAMKKVLMFIKNQTNNKVITLFGCGGNRDREKRPQMMEIATLYSDEVYLTSDNPRFEDPLDIMKDALMGIKNDRVHLYVDRRLAIYNAVKSLNNGDFLLILGKGNEHEQIVLDNKIKFNDLDEVEKWMN